MTPRRPYMRGMHPEADQKRLYWRAHHRGIKEADILIGAFYDAHHASWSEEERLKFETMLEEQDVDILAWATGTAEAPERYHGSMLEALKRLDYVPLPK
jgi:antitoxin CptB